MEKKYIIMIVGGVCLALAGIGCFVYYTRNGGGAATTSEGTTSSSSNGKGGSSDKVPPAKTAGEKSNGGKGSDGKGDEEEVLKRMNDKNWGTAHKWGCLTLCIKSLNSAISLLQKRSAAWYTRQKLLDKGFLFPVFIH